MIKVKPFSYYNCELLPMNGKANISYHRIKFFASMIYGLYYTKIKDKQKGITYSVQNLCNDDWTIFKTSKKNFLTIMEIVIKQQMEYDVNPLTTLKKLHIHSKLNNI
jgi:hypothetical protein